MRLWSLAPAILDRAALVACWREGLLAQKVLAGLTKGYTKHPQLTRFRATPDPMGAIGFFLGELQREATARGYNFNAGLINHPTDISPRIPVTDGQVAYELGWLRAKVRKREPGWITVLDQERAGGMAAASFAVVPGGIEEWEKITPPKAKAKANPKVKRVGGEEPKPKPRSTVTSAIAKTRVAITTLRRSARLK